MLLIIGATSKLSKFIKLYFDNNDLFFSDKRRGFDYLIDLNNIEDLDIDQRITHAIFLAGITNIQKCEENPKLARKINGDNTIELIYKLNNKGIKVLFPSSTCVFSSNSIEDNFELSERSPDNIYGEIKSYVEINILRNKLNTVLRLSKVINPDDYLLSNWKLNLLENKKISVFCDLKLSPLCVYTVMEFFKKWYHSNNNGILHLSPSSDLTYLELSNKLSNFLSTDKSLINPVSAFESSKKILYSPLKSYLSCKLNGSRSLEINNEIEKIFNSLY